MVSGGKTSLITADRVIKKHGLADTWLMFADVVIEDDDLYRFLIEGAAFVTGIPLADVADLAQRALELPPEKTECGEDNMAARKEALRALRFEANQRIPHLWWIAEGRTPWDVFDDTKFLGNSRVDPCSRILKREFMAGVIEELLTPDDVTIYLGIGWWEEYRMEKVRERRKPWIYEAPLCDRPYLTDPMMNEMVESWGIRLPRLYPLGFKHNNCGGGCVKAGIGQFAHLHKVLPKVYDRWESNENHLRGKLGDVAMLKDRRGGTVKPLPLAKLRRRLEGQDETLNVGEINDTRGCGCAIDDGDEDAR